MIVWTEKQLEARKIFSQGQRHTMFVGGSRSGKTFNSCDMIVTRMRHFEETRHVVLRKTAKAAKVSLALDTIPKVLRLGHGDLGSVKHQKSDGYFELSNGSQLWYGGLDDKDRIDKILGNEYLSIYFNECSLIPYETVTTVLSRLAQKHPRARQRALYDENPKAASYWTNVLFGDLKDPSTGQPLKDPNNYRRIFMNPLDNTANLDPEYIASLDNLPELARKRFLLGEYITEVKGALWQVRQIAGLKVAEDQLPKMQRVVVAIDPSGGKNNDEQGIVVAGKGIDGLYYVLADYSCSLSTDGWSKRAISAFDKYNADRIIAEKNYGGEMVESVLRNISPNIPYKAVHASKGKHVRAEPIAALYEQNKVKHVRGLDLLENQMVEMTTQGWQGEGSPDRLDALVWGLTELSETTPVTWGRL